MQNAAGFGYAPGHNGVQEFHPHAVLGGVHEPVLRAVGDGVDDVDDAAGLANGAYHPVVAFDRIAVDHRIMGGVPCVKGSRIPVATVVGMVAEGMTTDEIRSEFPQLTTEDVQASLRYAAAAVDERELPLRTAG